MARDIETLVLALNGAPINRTETPGWKGFFVGDVTTQNMVVEDDDRFHFELCFPTLPDDRDDYIFSTEREAGTTKKVRLMLAGRPIDARVVAIVRRGSDSDYCDDQGPEEYRLTFEVPRQLADARVGEPLRVEFTFPVNKQDVVYAFADGAP